MLADLAAPLEVGEEYVELWAEASGYLAAGLSIGQVGVEAMARLIDVAESGGMEITRGPEVIRVQRPEYPGDATWIRVVAVARPSS